MHMAYIGLRLRWIACTRRHPPLRRPHIWPVYSYVSGELHELGAIHLSGDPIYGIYRVLSEVDCMY